MNPNYSDKERIKILSDKEKNHILSDKK